MQRCLLSTKIHRAAISEADLNYVGSLTIPPEVIEATGLLPYEQIMIANLANGERFTTYVMVGTRPGHFCLNGAAARMGEIGDRIIVFSFAWLDENEAAAHAPRIVQMDEANRIVGTEGPMPSGKKLP